MPHKTSRTRRSQNYMSGSLESQQKARDVTESENELDEVAEMDMLALEQAPNYTFERG